MSRYFFDPYYKDERAKLAELDARDAAREEWAARVRREATERAAAPPVAAPAPAPPDVLRHWSWSSFPSAPPALSPTDSYAGPDQHGGHSQRQRFVYEAVPQGPRRLSSDA